MVKWGAWAAFVAWAELNEWGEVGERMIWLNEVNEVIKRCAVN